jgi:multiple sugar transport system ATP-binding protein
VPAQALLRFPSSSVRLPNPLGPKKMTAITIENLTKVYDDGTRALCSFDLEIADGEFVVFVGPSGCGKTTALRMIAGLEKITEGVIRIGDEVVNELAPRDRDVAMIFQNYALYPHMSVYDNMAFGLKVRGVPKTEIARRVNDAALVLGLTDQLIKRPRALSGGQRQRVAMGRAIVREPKAFLMDEPLSNLDAKLRVHMRAEIARMQRTLHETTVYVTHDQSEAMTLGDRVCVLRMGLLQQVDRPQVIYEHPANLFVAAFIGSPAMNVVDATLERVGDDFEVVFGAARLTVDPSVLVARPALGRYVGRRIALGIRPEDIEDAALVPDTPASRRFSALLDVREDMGSEVFLHFAPPAPSVLSDPVEAALEQAGEDAAEQRRRSFVARVGRTTRAHERETVELAVDTRLLHFFDLESGVGIWNGADSTQPI